MKRVKGKIFNKLHALENRELWLFRNEYWSGVLAPQLVTKMGNRVDEQTGNILVLVRDGFKNWFNSGNKYTFVYG
jgi:hypothetical protein